MPIFNEEATIRTAISRVASVDYPCPVELVVVDDGSSDGTVAVLDELEGDGIRVMRHPVNRGKGAAVRTGVRAATGTHVLILDADLEYSPADIPSMMAPVLNRLSDHVFGSRVFGNNTRFPSYRYAIGGRMTTHFANVVFDSCLTDMHTCFKLIPRQDFERLSLNQNGFGLDTQLTTRMLRAGVRPYEVPISYNGRTAAEGKKISWVDGISCVAIILANRLRPRRQISGAGIGSRTPDASSAVVTADVERGAEGPVFGQLSAGAL
ncbi:glycosyltransferase family 2 protein [Gordonia sputi]|uniref:glycosyltransferase family 2 protein n=1 Tax=Gordonia sputi TaxID=36823 RepID=UPI0036A96FEC